MIAVQEPLTSLAEDIAVTRRAIARAGGPVVLVGHSNDGRVISGAAVDQSAARSLVFVAAIALDKDESYPMIAAKYPPRRFPKPWLPTSLDISPFVPTGCAKRSPPISRSGKRV